MRVTSIFFRRLGGASPRQRVAYAVAAFACVALSSCGSAPMSSSDPGSATPSSENGPTGESPSSGVPGAASCGSVAVSDADLTSAQFAFVGRVRAVVDEVPPWTTDPGNSDRPDVLTTTKWVTFDVERWYLNDWGVTFAVWMPDISVSPGERVAVGGNAYFTQVAEFAGQSGEVEFCNPLADGQATVPHWDARFGEAFAPSATTSTTIVLAATKVFGEHRGPCEPTVLDHGDGAANALAAGAACFLAEVDGGRPVVWDVRFPTEEGDPIVTRYDFDGSRVTITTDYSFDHFGSGGVIEETCPSVIETNGLPSGVDCITTTGVGFLEAGLDG